jgi:hypothetical protein
MNKKIVVCGDSFNIGIGCEDLYNQPYGILVSKHFGWDLLTLARGSASNYAVFLQAKYAADLPEKPHLIVIAQTSYDRIEWIKEGKDANYDNTLHNLNYHEYPPHHEPQPHHANPLDYHLQNDKKYNPYILTEQIGALEDCRKFKLKKQRFDYYERMNDEPEEKLKLISDYYLKIFDISIKRDYDIGLLVQAYTYVRRKGIQCIVLTNDDKFKDYIDEIDIMYQDWGTMSLQYPDTIGSFHTSHLGHRDTAHRLIRKIVEDERTN